MKQMYKVFLNDRVIKIGTTGNITINKPLVNFNEKSTVDAIRRWFRTFEASNLDEAWIIHPNPEEFFTLFQAAFTVIQAAGGVVVAEDRLLFIFRNGKWDLPKGKLDKGESAEEAALREVEEETGITPEGIEHRLPSTFHIYKSPYSRTRGQWIFKETYWFHMSYNGNLSGTPQQEEGITQVKWVAKDGLGEILSNTYENLKQIIALYL